MRKYIVSHVVTADQLAEHIAKVGGVHENGTVAIYDDTMAEPPAQSNQPKKAAAPAAPERAPRAKRGSKVNTAILTAMARGPASNAELKAALKDAGLAEGSLSTGLMLLQKSGEIERVGDGKYQLSRAPLQQAAE